MNNGASMASSGEPAGGDPAAHGLNPEQPAPHIPTPETPAAPRPRPLSRAALHDLAENEALNSTAFEAALRLTRIRPGFLEWRVFWFHLLSLCGALLLASGILFFIAWNWADLHHFAKFGILQAVIAACVGLALWRKVESVAGSAALLVAGICIGPLLAVFGQTYMSGEHYWVLFRVWMFMLLPLALLGRQAGLWFLVWLTGCVFGFGYLQHFSHARETFFALPECILLQLFAVAVWEAALRLSGNRPGQEWLHSLWVPRTVFLCTWLFLSALLCGLLTDEYFRQSTQRWGVLFLPVNPSICLTYCVGLPCLFFWYRRVRPDLFMLSVGIFSLAGVLVALLVRHGFFMYENASSFLFWGIAIAALTAGCGKILLGWQRSMEGEEGREKPRRGHPLAGETANAPTEDSGTEGHAGVKEARTPVLSERRTFFGSPRLSMDWATLWSALVRDGVWPAGKKPPLPPLSGSPWFVNIFLALGGWVTALFLGAFLAFLLAVTLNIHNNFEYELLVGGAIFLGIGAWCSRQPRLFFRQFGLASALTGAVSLCFSFEPMLPDERYWPLTGFVVCVAGFLLVRNRAFRSIAACLGLLFLYSSLHMTGSWLFQHCIPETELIGDHTPGVFARNAHLVWWWSFWVFSLFFWAFVSIFMALAWTREGHWMTNKNRASFMPCLLHGLFISMVLQLVVPLFFRAAGFTQSFLPFPPQSSIGLGAGIGFLTLVALLVRPLAANRPERWLCLCSATLSIAAGWFLPGVTVALFGLCISRQVGNTVLAGACGLFLATDLFYYYYQLETTLLYKSVSLMVCGAVLLGLAFGADRYFGRWGEVSESPGRPPTAGTGQGMPKGHDAVARTSNHEEAGGSNAQA